MYPMIFVKIQRDEPLWVQQENETSEQFVTELKTLIKDILDDQIRDHIVLVCGHIKAVN